MVTAVSTASDAMPIAFASMAWPAAASPGRLQSNARHSRSSTIPATSAQAITVTRYSVIRRLPKCFLKMPSVPILVAGPASRNTRAAPGDMPATSRPAAIGVEAVAQTYIGMPITAIRR